MASISHHRILAYLSQEIFIQRFYEMRANFPFVINWHARFDFNASNKLESHCYSIISETQYLKREWQLSWCLTIFGILECITIAQSIIDSPKINWLFQFYQSFRLFFFPSLRIVLFPFWIIWNCYQVISHELNLKCLEFSSTIVEIALMRTCADSNRPSQSFESWCVQLFLFL